MKIKINKEIGLYMVLIFAITNASLRLQENGMTSLFRMISPIVALVILCSHIQKLYKSLLILLSGMVYSLFVSIIGYGIISYKYMVFVWYIYILFIIVVELRIISSDFEKDFWKFLNAITLICIFLAIIQMFVRIPYPYVELPVEHGVNLFMSNENELGEPLGFVSIIYLYKILFENKKIYIPVVVIINIIEFVNDSKLTILGCLLGYVILFYFKLGKKIKISSKQLFNFGIFSLFFIIVLCYIVNPIVTFRDYSITLRELIFDSLLDIVRLRPMPGAGGSTVDRTNAIIYGLQELINSKFLGIGWGNSVVMLGTSKYKLLTAKSMHNLVVQFLCEMGIFAIVVYGCFVKWIITHISKLYNQRINILKLVFIISFIIISSQSSIGILSNYYSWIIVFYVALCKEKIVS